MKFPRFESKMILLASLAALTLSLSAAYASGTSETIISRIPGSAVSVAYIPDVRDFGNFRKWSPIYNYIFLEEYGGLTLTLEGERLLEKFERWVRMPARDLLTLFSGEAAFWAELSDFSKKGVSLGAAFATDRPDRWKGIIDDNFVNNREYATCQKAGSGEYSYFISFKFPDILGRKTGPSLGGEFAVEVGSCEVIVATDAQYLKKIAEYSASTHEKEPAFASHLASLKSSGATGVFVDLSGVYDLAVRTAENAGAAKENAPVKAKENADDVKTFKEILSVLDLKSLSCVRLRYVMEESRIVGSGEVVSSGRTGLLKILGKGYRALDVASVCPADSSTLIFVSFDFVEFMDLYEKLVEKAPPVVRTQYFMAKTAAAAFLGMKIREDVMGMFDGGAAFVTKLMSTKADPVLSLPTAIFNLKNPKTAERIVARLSEKGLLAEFEEKEMLGYRYFSLKKPIAGNFTLTFAVAGEYLVVSSYFEHFSAVLKLLKKPGDGLSSQKKFVDAVADLPEKLSILVFSNDEEVSDIYFRNAEKSGRLSAPKNETPFFKQNPEKIDWAKIKAHQAPSAFGAWFVEKGLELRGISQFKRDN